MSRLDSKVAEANRLDFIKVQAKIKQDAITANWLKDNPQIGTLNNGQIVTFYFFNANNEMVMVEQPKN